MADIDKANRRSVSPQIQEDFKEDDESSSDLKDS